MSERSGYFPYVAGDPNSEYGSSFIAALHAALIKNGVHNGELGVTADGSAMTVTLPAGRAWINGYFYRNDAPITLTIDNADGVLNRKDIIVLRWDVNARSITAQVVKGAVASDAVAPVIIRTVEQYDLKLAEISIPAGTTAITQALITDFRLNTDVCGIVTGLITQVDTTTFYNQIAADLAAFKSDNESGFSTWSAAQQAAFNTWLDGIKDALDGDTAGNLLNQINQRAYTALSCTKSGTVYALTGLTATSGKVPVMFSADAAFAAGDTITIDGTAYAIQTRDGSTLTSGAWAAGAIITGTADVDNHTLTVEPSAPVGSRPATWMPNATDVGALAWRGILNNPDLNTVLTPGSYYVQGCTNGPAQFGFLDVKQGYTSAYLLQVFYDINTHCMFTRKYQDDTFETSWALLSGGFLILNKSDSIPTGLADNTIVLRKQS